MVNSLLEENRQQHEECLAIVSALGFVVTFKIATTHRDIESLKYWTDIQLWLNLIESVALILLLYLLATEVFKEE